MPGDIWEAELGLLERGWASQPRAFPWVPVGESDLSPVPQFPHLKIIRGTGKVLIGINCCLLSAWRAVGERRQRSLIAMALCNRPGGLWCAG